MKSLRKDAEQILQASLRAADPYEAVLRHVSVTPDGLRVAGQTFSWKQYQRVLVLGAGKASVRMAQAMEELLGGRISAGLLNTKDGHGAPLRRIAVQECSHPVPDERGVLGTEKMLRAAAGATEHDLVICLISGGASALMPLPAPSLTLEEKQAVTRLLLASGATIHEINTVRKHLSQSKGGQLASAAYPATLLTLVLSDVVGDDLDVIGSGPTVPDTSTFHDAAQVLQWRGIWDAVPSSVQQRLQAGQQGRLPETPKPGDPRLSRSYTEIIGSNRLAVEAAEQEARRLGYQTLILSTTVEGEARELARLYAAMAREIRHNQRPIRPPACVLAGGETTVTLRGQGKGGRNQEFALAAGFYLQGMPEVLVAGLGTDGTDGPTDAAGGLGNGSTVERARQQGWDVAQVLQDNNSYPLLQALDDLLVTGPTGTNVMDVYCLLVS